MVGRLFHAIIRGFHCHNPHHRFAWDALPLVQTDAGHNLLRLLYRYQHHYLTGATDPDTRFRDFQNHVIHTRDGFWGGAPRVAHAWYERLQRYLRSNRFADAAHAAGVLSHYFTDPLHPLHTHHDRIEKILHGPIDWSLHYGYESILKSWQQNELQVVFQLSTGPGWLGEAILHSARYANRKYETLLDGYDPTRTLDDPLGALSSDARMAMAELFGLAITGWARVLERAAADAEIARGGSLPHFGSTFPTVVAAARIPTQWYSGWSQDRLLRSEIAELLEEWRVTGMVEKNLPVEVDIVHRVIRVRADEKNWNRQRRDRLNSRRTTIGVNSPVRQSISKKCAAIPIKRAA